MTEKYTPGCETMEQDCGPAIDTALMDSAVNRMLAGNNWTTGAESALSLTSGALEGMMIPWQRCTEGRSDYARRLLLWLRQPNVWAQVLTREEAAQDRRAAEQQQRAYVLAVRAAESKWRKAVSKTVRAACGLSGTPYPIVAVEGDSKPTLCGESWHYQTRGGRRIYHPSAYSRRGWSNMVYVGSSRRIEVGRKWLKVNGFPIAPDAIAE